MLLTLNDDILSHVMGWLGGLDLFNCGITCKRLYNLTNSLYLWRHAAELSQDESLPLPLYFGDDIQNASLPYLRSVTARACRLHHSFTTGKPQLYKQTIIKPSWDPRPWKQSAREMEAGVFSGFIHIFDGRWIISRRKEYISIRHVNATQWKEKFDVSIVEFTDWPFQICQISRDVGLIALFHYVTKRWNILEVTFGKTRQDKPTVRNLEFGEAKNTLSLIGSGLVAFERSGMEIIMDVYSSKSLSLDQAREEVTNYCIADDILFSAFSTRLGQICISAYRLDRERGLVDPQSRISHNIELGALLSPSDSLTEHEVVHLCRSSSRKPALTIWHSMSKVKKSGLKVQFVIELPFSLSDGLEGGNECVQFAEWQMYSTRLPPGNHYIGQNGFSSVISQYNQEKASVWVYPRLGIPGGYNTQHFGRALPLPSKACWGMNLNEVRVAWDDARGIAVLVFNDGGLWVLHYA